ncbi:hypothetical protein [Paenibacillus zanthoxyli]|uniref:hypothetical protein n=1 Tax=Paenibacillus zanthoxyli TaxID=369399 RepID=UPI0004727B63|nr:hypothetical protein [Paenibacillus zanthoxyli]
MQFKPRRQSVCRLLAILAFLYLIPVHMPAAKAYSNSITNPGFETGTLSGWTIESGDAFSSGDVASDTDYWNRQKFNQHNFWHIWGGRGDNAKVGVLKSETFTLAATDRSTSLSEGTATSTIFTRPWLIALPIQSC